VQSEVHLCFSSHGSLISDISVCSKNTNWLSQMRDDILQFHMQHVHLDWRKDSRGSTGMLSVFLSTETVTVSSDDV
jgi:hypothetical protein